MSNNLLNEELQYNGKSQEDPQLILTSYNATEIKQVSGAGIRNIKDTIDNNRINWLQTYGLRDTNVIRDVCEYFGINFLVVQDILNAEHPTKIEEYENFTFIITKIFRFNEANREDELERQQIAIILGNNFVLTFMEWKTPIFDGIHQALKHNTLRIRTRQSDYLFSVLLNSVVSNYTYIVNSIDDVLDDLEEELLDISNSNTRITKEIQSVRRQYLQIKRAVLPLKEQSNKFLRSENQLIHKVNRAFFNDVNDHLQFVLETIELCRETLSSLVDLYLYNNDVKRNDIMKRLTIVSTIFIPITFLAGVWGMNFDIMPELNWKYGYLVAWLILGLIGGGIYGFFRWKGWY